MGTQITDTKEVEAQRTMTSLMAASGAAHRTFTPNAHSRVSAVYRYAGPAAERKLGAAMVAAASKFGSQHQAEVRAALSEDISSPARRDALRIALLGAATWLPSNAASAADDQGVASSRMSYSRFLEYLDMGRVKKVDLYANGTIAIVEAVSPELGNRVQRVRVQLPGTSSELLKKFREKNVDFAAHTNTEDNGQVFLNLLGGGLFLLTRRQQGGGGGMPGGMGGPNNPMAF